MVRTDNVIGTRGELIIGTFPGPNYLHVPGLFNSAKKWPGPGPRYQYTAQRAKDNKLWTDKFSANSESDRGSHDPYCTDNETLVYVKFK